MSASGVVDDATLARDAPQFFVISSSSSGWRALGASDRAAHASHYAAQLHDALAHLHSVARRAHGRVCLESCVVNDKDPASLRLLLAPPHSQPVNFSPPEAVAAGESSASSSATTAGDIYSYGCVLYWLANGTEPFATLAARRNALVYAITKQTATKAMPLSESMPMFAEIRAATRHKPLKRALLRAPVVDAPSPPAATAAAAAAPLSPKSVDTFKQRAANRQSRVVGGSLLDAGAAAAATSSRAKKSSTLRTLRRTSRGADESAAFAALFGNDALAMLRTIVAERAQEGIFRVPGDADDIEAFAAGRTSLDSIRSVHTLASLLKRAFREHSPALVPDAADREARELLKLAEQADPNGDDTGDEIVDQLRTLLRAQFTDTQRLALRHLARAFHSLVAAERDNKMSLEALLICVGPSFHCAPGWIKWAVLRFDRMFKDRD